MLAIIGGSGFENFENIENLSSLPLQTPYGDASSGLRYIKAFGQECVFLPRHGRNHERMPSEVNYRANLYALKKAGADRILSFSAVGSLRKELAPGDLVIPSQYIDRTKGLRDHTFCGEGLIAHVSLAEPIWKEAKEWMQSHASSFNFQTHFDKTYVCIEGPYFSTRAESHTYRMMNADIIGMTNFPEFALARELEIAYLPCCFVTDYDCWDESMEHVTIQMVLNIMKQSNAKAYAIIKQFISASVESDPSLRVGIASSILAKHDLSERAKALLEILSS